MAKAKKLPSGNWRVLVFDYKDDQGRRHYESVTADTKAEAEYKAALFKKNKKTRQKPKIELTVGQAIDRYIELSQTLSPTTVQRYENMRKYGFPDLMEVKTSKLTDELIQFEINKEAKRKSAQTGKQISAKTVTNEWGLVSSALRSICGMSFSVRLPKKQKKHKELPDPKVIIDLIKGTDIELPCLLAMWLSFSMSEIRGFKCSSIRDSRIYVDQVRVNVSGVPTEKENAKVETRKRAQSVPDHIMDLIKSQDNYTLYTRTGEDSYLVTLNQNEIYNRFKKLTTAEGIEMTFHDLRHMFASIMLTKLQIPEKVVQDEGGWSTPHIMKSVYSNTFSDSRQTADKIRDDFFESLF